MNRVLATLLALGGLGAMGAAAVVLGGIYNVSARAGHWPGVEWVLHSTYESSVRVRAPSPSGVPELTDDLARLGARHFDAACRTCHASPGEDRTATTLAMQPPPPRIADAVAGWKPNELAWIVREGVGMSGMPGWPSARDDEVWAVVAFLVRVGSMDAATYAALTASPSAEGPPGLAHCAGCHGADGRSGNPHVPRLDILTEPYLAGTLQAYRTGARESGIMAQAATTASARALDALAAYFADRPPSGLTPATDPALAAAGRDLALGLTGDRDVPACGACHDPRAGAADPAVAPAPSIAGQHEAYLVAQLRLWRDGPRGGGPRVDLMRLAARDLTDADIAALAAYYAGLGPVQTTAAD